MQFLYVGIRKLSPCGDKVEEPFQRVLLISEDLDEILALSDRIAVIYEGQIMDIVPRADATPEKLGLLIEKVEKGNGNE